MKAGRDVLSPPPHGMEPAKSAATDQEVSMALIDWAELSQAGGRKGVVEALHPATIAAPRPAPAAEHAPERLRPNLRQYLLQLDDTLRRGSARAFTAAAPAVDRSELEGLAERVAELKGHYLAAVLDIGRNGRQPTPLEAQHLARLRGTLEELEHGLRFVRDNAASGQIHLEGVVSDH